MTQKGHGFSEGPGRPATEQWGLASRNNIPSADPPSVSTVCSLCGLHFLHRWVYFCLNFSKQLYLQCNQYVIWHTHGKPSVAWVLRNVHIHENSCTVKMEDPNSHHPKISVHNLCFGSADSSNRGAGSSPMWTLPTVLALSLLTYIVCLFSLFRNFVRIFPPKPPTWGR